MSEITPQNVAMLEALEVGVIHTDRLGVITFSNERARLMVGRDATPVGLQSADVVGLAGSPQDLLGSERLRVFEHVGAVDGTSLHLVVTIGRLAHPLADGFFLLLRDTLEEKLREDERRRFEHLAALGTMVAGFAHEIRNPVAALRSITEELAEDLSHTGRPSPHTTRMLRVLDRMERLVRTSLQFGRPTPPRPAPHRPWTICSAALSGVAARTISAGEPIHVEIEPDLPDVFVDHGQLAQVLVVLLENALDVVTSPAHVVLRVTRPRLREADARARRSAPPQAPPTIRFDVTDDGPGIEAGHEQRIFDPFFTTKSGGTGLGLSIAKQLVLENKGRLEVTSIRNPTTLSMFLPVADEDTDG